MLRSVGYVFPDQGFSAQSTLALEKRKCHSQPADTSDRASEDNISIFDNDEIRHMLFA